jgi:uncharacterized protein
VHVSQLADRFVKDPHEVVKAGDIVRVRVTEVDIARKRIGLSMRKEGGSSGGAAGGGVGRAGKDRQAKPPAKPKQTGPRGAAAAPASQGGDGALGAALRDAMKGRR